LFEYFKNLEKKEKKLTHKNSPNLIEFHEIFVMDDRVKFRQILIIKFSWISVVTNSAKFSWNCLNKIQQNSTKFWLWPTWL